MGHDHLYDRPYILFTIDHIFYSDFTPLEYHTIMDRWNGVQYISDHYPISALLEFE